MRVRYRLPVLGRLRIDKSFPVTTPLFAFTFETNELGLVTHLNATASVKDKSSWPRVTATPQPGVKLDIHLSDPYFAELRRDMRAVRGILALYGVDDINVDLIDEVWEPENEEEKHALPLYSFKIDHKPTATAELSVVPFDLVARALLVTERAAGFDAALNFFRKGRADVRAEQYLDAVLDYLFMVETTYANGKFRSAHVEEEYLSSSELRKLLAETVSNPSLRSEVRRDSRIEQRFTLAYEGKSPEAVIPYIVNLRGELHHHSARKSGIWHPTDHIRFGADAYFLEYLCLGIAFAITHEALFGESTVQAYQEQARSNMASGTVKRHHDGIPASRKS
jgi:hypothetical protein